MEIHGHRDARGFEFCQKSSDAPVVIIGRIDIRHNGPIPISECINPHLGNDIGTSINIIPRKTIGQSVLHLKALVQRRSRSGLEHSNHGGYNSAFLYKIDLPLKNTWCITIEADDEPAHHLYPGVLNRFHIIKEIAVLVLIFMAFLKAGLVRRFDSNKNRIEPGPNHQANKFLVIREVDGSLRKKDASLFVSTPVDQCGQQFGLQVFFVSDKIIIHEKNAASPAAVIM